MYKYNKKRQKNIIKKGLTIEQKRAFLFDHQPPFWPHHQEIFDLGAYMGIIYFSFGISASRFPGRAKGASVFREVAQKQIRGSIRISLRFAQQVTLFGG